MKKQTRVWGRWGRGVVGLACTVYYSKFPTLKNILHFRGSYHCVLLEKKKWRSEFSWQLMLGVNDCMDWLSQMYATATKCLHFFFLESCTIAAMFYSYYYELPEVEINTLACKPQAGHRKSGNSYEQNFENAVFWCHFWGTRCLFMALHFFLVAEYWEVVAIWMLNMTW